MPGKRKTNKKYKKLGKGPEDFENPPQKMYGYPQAPKDLKINNVVNENPLQFWQRQKAINENNQKINALFKQMQNERKINENQQNDINYNKQRLKNITEKLERETRMPPQQKSFLSRAIDIGKTTYKYAKQIKPATKLLNAFPSLGEKKYIGVILKGAKSIGLGRKNKLKLGDKTFKNQKSKMAYVRSFKN